MNNNLDTVITNVKANPERFEELVIYYLDLTALGDLNRIQSEQSRIKETFEGLEAEYSKPALALMNGVYNYFVSVGRKAVDFFKSVLPPHYSWKSKNIQGVVHVLLGGTYRSIGELDRCIFHQHKAKKLISIEGELSNFLVFCYYNLGEVYMQINELDQAEECLKEGLEIITDHNQKFRLSSSLGNLNLSRNKLEEAEECFILAQEMADGESQNARAVYDLAVLNVEKGNFEKAIGLAEESYTIRINNNLKDAAATSQIIIAKAHLGLNKTQEAIEVLNEAMLNTVEHKAISKSKEIHLLLSKAYEKQQDWNRAFAEFKAYEKIQSGIFADQQKEIFKLKNTEIRKQKHIIEEVHREITDSINYAERIQKSFLTPLEIFEENTTDCFVLFQPKDVVSGDFYWADILSNGNLAILNADSTGHGVPGSIMSILNITSIEKAVENGHVKPAEIFNAARKTIIERLKKDGSEHGGKDGMDATLISFNKDKTKMDYVAANNPIWIFRNGELIEIKAEKMPVGKHDNDSIPFAGGTVDLVKGDSIYIMTDGFQDQFGGDRGKKFKVKPLKSLLGENLHLSMTHQKELLLNTLTSWKGDLEQVDDICLIGVKI